MKPIWIILLVTVVILGGLSYWIYQESMKPLVGQKVEDLGRGHVPIGTEVQYNSNPPTSGPHYGEWTRSGIYNEVKDDRNLVHSLEHGYVIISYNCDFKAVSRQPFDISIVYAHEEEDIFVSESTPSAEVSDECHQLVDQLKGAFAKKKLAQNKLIIVPRPSLNAKVALTAWNYLDILSEFDEERIIRFIDTHRGHGPEATME